MNNRIVLTFLAFLVLTVTLLNNVSWNDYHSKEIAYSDFLKLVDTGGVSSVVIKGEHIQGQDKSGNGFSTVSVADPTMLANLQRQSVAIKIEDEQDTPWYMSLLLQWGPLLFLIGIWLFMIRRMPNGNRIMSIGKSKAKQFKFDTDGVTFANVAGVDEAKEDLAEVVAFLKDTDKFQKLGGRIPRGLLMVGPPGTGKTLLAKAVAGEAGVPFFSISGSEFVEMFVGVGASRVRSLFDEAYKSAPCVVFIDEIDAVGRHRGAGIGSGNDEREQTLNALLVEMDGFSGFNGVITLAATNRADVLDPALLRPGRFDRQVEVGLPDIKGRKEILEVHARKIKAEADLDWHSIAQGTSGFSGADLENIVNEAALHAAKLNQTSVTLKDVEWARDKVMMGTERKSLLLTDEEKQRTAYYETGCAIIAMNTEKSDPLHKITIIPRGTKLGQTAFLPEGNRLSWEKEVLYAQIAVALGGYATEKVVFGDISTRCESDLKKASSIAEQMISKWGMNDTFGGVVLEEERQGNYLTVDYAARSAPSEDLQELLDSEIEKQINRILAQNIKILEQYREELDKLAAKLLEQETLTVGEIYTIVGKEQLTT